MVEIIPKPSKKPPFWLNILFYFSIVLVLVSFSSFFILNDLEKREIENLQNLEEVLAREKTPEEIALEEEFFGYQRKINDFSRLIEGRVSAVNFFDFLEGICHPRVLFTEIELNPKIAQVKISGRAESFSVLSQQMRVFREELLIKKINLSNIGIGKEEGVDFETELFLSPQVFQFKEHNYNE